MTIRRISTRILLQPSDISPSQDDMEVVGVFNPGAIQGVDEVILLVRVVERSRERRPGFFGLPRWMGGRIITDWVSESEWKSVDSRLVQRKADGLIRLTFTSHLRVVHCGEGNSVRAVTDVLFSPECELEEFGVEDPRITLLDSRFYFTYVAVSRHGPATALASTSDFRTFDRHGMIFCPENKDVVLFPDRIDGNFAALHRPVCGTPFTRPEVWVARSPDLRHWGFHSPLMIPAAEWQSGRVGIGPPPIRTPDGWLTIYHGNRQPQRLGEVGEYCGGALLLAIDDPTHILNWTEFPFFRPETDFERAGFVPNVVFPTGAVQIDERLLLYYGAADRATAVAEFSVRELLSMMTGTN
ncbi:glycosylase [bacterium]|nr:glycosylase [bacterium]